MVQIEQKRLGVAGIRVRNSLFPEFSMKVQSSIQISDLLHCENLCG